MPERLKGRSAFVVSGLYHGGEFFGCLRARESTDRRVQRGLRPAAAAEPVRDRNAVDAHGIRDVLDVQSVSGEDDRPRKKSGHI